MKLKVLCTILLSTLICSTACQAKKKAKGWEAKEASLPVVDEAKQAKVKAALPQKASATPQKARKALVFYRCEGFLHKSIAVGNYALKQLGEQTGAYTADFSANYDDLSAENLNNYDLLVFNNTTRLNIPEAQRKALLNFISQGKGIVGIHAASDNFYNWEEGIELMGGVFNGHPWTAGGTWAFKNEAPNNLLNQGFGGKDFMYQDEIYCYKKPIDRDTNKVLVSLDMSKEVNQKAASGEKHASKLGGVPLSEFDNPVSWYRNYGMGRLFYTNFGHNDSTFWSKPVMQHIADGIQFAMGDLIINN